MIFQYIYKIWEKESLLFFIGNTSQLEFGKANIRILIQICYIIFTLDILPTVYWCILLLVYFSCCTYYLLGILLIKMFSVVWHTSSNWNIKVGSYYSDFKIFFDSVWPIVGGIPIIILCFQHFQTIQSWILSE